MKSGVNKRITLVLTGAACVLFCTETASANFVTFWKTDTCPSFGGLKKAVAWEVGIMQAPVFQQEQTTITSGGELGCLECTAGVGAGIGIGIGVGGAHCVLDSANIAAVLTNGTKGRRVFNAEILVDETLDPGNPGTCDPLGGVDCVWQCVICQYRDKQPAIPTLSALGTALLLGGLMTAAIYRIRQKQIKATT